MFTSRCVRMGRGAFIVVEGVDRSGKTTQCSRLVEEMNTPSSPMVFMRFPDRSTSIGQMINGYLTNQIELPDECIHLLYSANRWEKQKEIVEHLEAGTTVLCDRYAYSGAAFSMAKGMDRLWCQQPDQGLPRPDALLFLHLSSEAAAKRPGFGMERYEESAFQLRVREAYKELEIHETDSVPWTRINADQEPEQVFEDMKTQIETTMARIQDSPILPLWKQ